MKGKIIMGETLKAYDRRMKEGWFDKFAPPNKKGIDVGGGKDASTQLHPGNENWRVWDRSLGDGDATLMKGVPDNSYDVVHASHILEHLVDTKTALQNWYRILKPGGYLIVLVPHRDLYEKKTQPPSHWNGDHKYFWVPRKNGIKEDQPKTKALLEEATSALPKAEVACIKVLNEGFHSDGPLKHSSGEYSIELIVKKPL